MFCDVLAVQDRLTECCGGGVPVPANDSMVGEFEAVLANDRLPDAAPVAEGVNVTVNPTCCPAGITIGYDGNPLSAKTGLFKVSEFTVTLATLAVSVPFSCAFVPTLTLPKFRLVGVTASCPWGTGVPVPLNGMPRFGFDASETIATFPLSLPGEGGVKVTVKV